jgi:phage terminase large subunit GpA-like protein
MTFGGSDKSRAAFPARVLVVTEVDGAVSSESSLEADKIKQLEARLRSHGSRKLVYLECTVTVEGGRIWSEYQSGTASRIVVPCPHCHAFVTPERDSLLGWQDADNVVDAMASAYFACPSCGHPWTEDDRRKANLAGQLVHRGQEVTADGRIVGPLPKTDALGFRWNAANNLFATAGDIAADEWRGKRARDRDNAERELLQFVWCIPYKEPEVDLVPLDPDDIARRHSGLKRGIVPAECVGITVGVDTGKRALHWTATAIMSSSGTRVVDYGIQTVEADRYGIKAALTRALRELQAYFAKGWTGSGGGSTGPSQVWIDSGWHEHTDAVYEFCREANAKLAVGRELYRPSKGYGEGERFASRYTAPKSTGSDVRYIGREFHLSRVRRAGQLLVHMNADHWKSELRQRLAMPADEAGSLVLWDPADKMEHADWIDQVLAEEPHEKIDSHNRPVTVWIRVRRKNHFLDATYQALAAGEFVLEVDAKRNPNTSSRGPSRSFATPDGRPFLVTERT